MLATSKFLPFTYPLLGEEQESTYEHNLNFVIFEGDSKLLINAVQSSSTSSSELDDLLAKLKFDTNHILRWDLVCVHIHLYYLAHN